MTQPNDHGAPTWCAELRGHFIAHATPPNDLRELLKTLSVWAYQARFKLDPTGMVNTAHEFYSGVNPWRPLYRVACEILGFPQTRWPAGLPEASTDFTELRSLLRSIEKHYGKTQTPQSLKRIEELVESILGGKTTEAKEPPALVSDPPKGPVTATTGVSKRTVELARSIPDGGPVVVLPPVGKLTAEGWCFGEKKLKFPPILKSVLKAYIAGKKDFRRTDRGNLRQRKSELKALIQRAIDEAGYQPVPNRWPKSTKLDGGGVIILFNGRDDENTRTQGAGKTG